MISMIYIMIIKTLISAQNGEAIMNSNLNHVRNWLHSRLFSPLNDISVIDVYGSSGA